MVTVSLSLRFWAKVAFGDPTECWLWQGCINPRSGYGQFRVTTQRTTRAHVASWMLTNGREVPPGLEVCHQCDVRACVNPFHLYAGTRSQNQRDRTRRMPPPTQKLTIVQVEAIRLRYQEGDIRQYELAEEYGVSAAAISRLLAGRTFA